MRRHHLVLGAVFLFAAALAACGGGGAGDPTTVATATPSPASSETQTVTLGSAPTSARFTAIASGASGVITFPGVFDTFGGTTLLAAVTLQSSLPVAAPRAPQARRMVLGGTVNAIAYITFTPNAAVEYNATPTLSFSFPAGTLSGDAYLAFYDPANPNAGWNAILGPVPASGTSLTFTNAATLSPPVTLSANTTYTYAIVETGTPLPTPAPTSAPTPTVSPSATSSPSATPQPTPTTTPTATQSPTSTPTATSSASPSPTP